MIHIVAIITAKPGKRSELLSLVRGNLPLVRAEDGCVEYSPVVDHFDSAHPFGPDMFIVIEKWRDEATLAKHRVASHMQRYLAQSKDLVAHRAVHVLASI